MIAKLEGDRITKLGAKKIRVQGEKHSTESFPA
jgi:hypothetical protein